ncbi:MAG TPA: nuclear transport factor 2 family protein [Ilumatobacteraceae bacterium]|nr:nuclear transport factor 2 family protein [Ilumatobacteraceae bacterium]
MASTRIDLASLRAGFGRWTVVVALASLPACSMEQTAAVPDNAELTPLEVVSWWNEARNVGDVAGAMSLLADDAVVLDFEIRDSDDRAALTETLTAQAVAGWHVVDHDCATVGETVTCRYVMADRILRRWGLELIGTHQYTLLDGRIRRAERAHDAQSAARVYDALNEFRRWVAERHPDLVDVIWASPGAAAYSTVEGARAMVSLLDEYDATCDEACG